MEQKFILNLVVSCNKSYIEPMKTMIYSLRQNTSATLVHVYFLNLSLSSQEIASFASFVSEIKDCELTVLPCPSRLFTNLKSWGYFTIDTYARLIVHDLLPPDVKRALWLDADVVVVKNIDQLYLTDMGNAYVAVCPEDNQDSPEKMELRARMKLSDSRVIFYAGTLLYNLARLRDDFPDYGLLRFARDKSDQLVYLDQDVLNAAVGHNVVFVETSLYCYCIGPLVFATITRTKEMNRAAIIHYAGPYKPWSPSFYGRSLKYWKKYALSSQVYKKSFFRKTTLRREKARAAFVISHMAELLHKIGRRSSRYQIKH